ncbi:MAG: FecR domain-containing protein [Polyangiaceae bacterium]|nr:FecR domain-containing protein [Polyangiaceae bacterium]
MTDPRQLEPIASELDAAVDEVDVYRIWRRVQERDAARRGRSWAKSPLALVAVAAALVVLVGLGAWMARRPSDPGPLAATDGGAVTAWSVPAGSTEQRVSFTDGSSVELGRGSRLEVLTNGSSSFVTSLRRGTGSFDVEPGGPRRWVIECGFVTVEVVGTRFRVDRQPVAVAVAVEHGKVRVRGEGFERLLVDGETVTFTVPRSTPSAAPRPEPTGDPDPVVESMSSSEPPASSNAPSAPIASPPAGSAATATADPYDALLHRADTARQGGDRVAATRLLERVAREAPDRARRELARYTLARLALDDDPARAAAELDRALDGGLPRGLGEDALARLVEAHARAGEIEAARARAREYEAKYPAGRHLSEVRYWTEGR